MSDIDYLYRLYDENLSGKTFALNTREIGSNRYTRYVLRFQDFNAKHLIGQDSDWHEDKVEAFRRMCFPNTWQMVGEYKESMGVNLDADILVGGVNCVFGFRYDWDLEDGSYYPCTCMLIDIRDHTYSPLYNIESIEDASYEIGDINEWS